LCEAFEENARRKVSGFQTGQITRLSDRRSQATTKTIEAKAISPQIAMAIRRFAWPTARCEGRESSQADTLPPSRLIKAFI